MKISSIARVITAMVLAISVLASLLWLTPVTSAAKASAPDPQGWIGSGSNSTAVLPTVLVNRADSSEIVLSAQSAGISANLFNSENGLYTRLEGENFAHGASVGLPDLPVIRQDVEVPFGAKVSLEVVRASFREVTLASLGLPALVYPLQPPLCKCGSAPLFNRPEAAVYSAATFYPSALAVISADYVLRGHRALTLDFNSVAYNPVSGVLRIYSNIQVRLGLTGADMAFSQAQSARYASPAFENRLSQQLLNFNEGRPARLFSPKSAVGYLIITPDSYLSALSPFVTLKQDQGFTVSVATLSEMGSTKEFIKL